MDINSINAKTDQLTLDELEYLEAWHAKRSRFGFWFILLPTVALFTASVVINAAVYVTCF